MQANIHEAKTNFSKLIDRALAGEEVIVAKAGRPLVRLVPINSDKPRRQFGLDKGAFSVPDDFDAADPEIEKMFYGQDD